MSMYQTTKPNYPNQNTTREKNKDWSQRRSRSAVYSSRNTDLTEDWDVGRGEGQEVVILQQSEVWAQPEKEDVYESHRPLQDGISILMWKEEERDLGAYLRAQGLKGKVKMSITAFVSRIVCLNLLWQI